MGQEHFVSKPPVKSQHVGIRAHHVAKSEEYKTYFDFELLMIVNFFSDFDIWFWVFVDRQWWIHIFVVVVEVNVEIYLPVMPEKTRGTVGHPEGE